MWAIDDYDKTYPQPDCQIAWPPDAMLGNAAFCGRVKSVVGDRRASDKVSLRQIPPESGGGGVGRIESAPQSHAKRRSPRRADGPRQKLRGRRRRALRSRLPRAGSKPPRPAGPDVSIDPVSDRNFAPAAPTRSRMVRRSLSERDRRSSFQTRERVAGAEPVERLAPLAALPPAVGRGLLERPAAPGVERQVEPEDAMALKTADQTSRRSPGKRSLDRPAGAGRQVCFVASSAPRSRLFHREARCRSRAWETPAFVL